MAHQSGFGGEFALTGTTKLTKITRWELDQTHRTIEAGACNDTYVSTFLTAYEWGATVDVLLQDDMAADDWVSGQTGTATFTINASDSLTGAVIITDVRTAMAVDAPATLTLSLVGSGALSHVAA